MILLYISILQYLPTFYTEILQILIKSMLPFYKLHIYFFIEVENENNHSFKQLQIDRN